MAKINIVEKSTEFTSIRIYPTSGSTCTDNWTPSDPSLSGWECVQDDDENYISMATVDEVLSLFALPSTLTDLGEINNINLYAEIRSVGGDLTTEGYLCSLFGDSECSLYDLGTRERSGEIDVEQAYRYQKIIISSDPFTEDTWEWDDLTNYVIGVRGSSPTSLVSGRLTLFPDSDYAQQMPDTLMIPTSTNHYSVINEMPHNPSRYQYKDMAFPQKGNVYSLGYNNEAMKKSDNDIIYLGASKTLYAYTYDSDTEQFTLLDSLSIEDWVNSNATAGDFGLDCVSCDCDEDLQVRGLFGVSHNRQGFGLQSSGATDYLLLCAFVCVSPDSETPGDEEYKCTTAQTVFGIKLDGDNTFKVVHYINKASTWGDDWYSGPYNAYYTTIREMYSTDAYTSDADYFYTDRRLYEQDEGKTKNQNIWIITYEFPNASNEVEEIASFDTGITIGSWFIAPGGSIHKRDSTNELYYTSVYKEDNLYQFIVNPANGNVSAGENEDLSGVGSLPDDGGIMVGAPITYDDFLLFPVRYSLSGDFYTYIMIYKIEGDLSLTYKSLNADTEKGFNPSLGYGDGMGLDLKTYTKNGTVYLVSGRKQYAYSWLSRINGYLKWELDTTNYALIPRQASITETSSLRDTLLFILYEDGDNIYAIGSFQITALYVHDFSELYDIYTFDDPDTPTGDITGVTVGFIASNEGIDSCIFKSHLLLDASHASMESTHNTSDNKLFHHTYTENPSGGTWEWDDISSVSGSVEIIPTYPPSINRRKLINTFLQVDYEYEASPEIRVRRLFAEVIYTPTPETVTLNMPSEVITDHTRITKILNFWDGTREVYDLRRSGKKLLITGMEYSYTTDPWIEFDKLRTIGKRGSTVEITDFTIPYFNGEYKILSFNYTVISEQPMVYQWALELGDTQV